jgi:hypothetical protein
VSRTTDDSYVSDAEWASWERERERRNALYAARARREARRPVEPTREDMLLQIHALRHHNESLVAELERLRALAWGYVLGQIERMGD